MQAHSGCSQEIHVEGSKDGRMGLRTQPIPTVAAAEGSAECTEALNLA